MLDLALQNPNLYFMIVVLVIFSVCCHEYMHARVALWQGDSTAADEGHLTLNPLKQMGPLSIFLTFVIGLAFGAVPVNPSRMRHRYSPALVAFAGPFVNLVLFLIFCLGLVIVTIKSGSMSEDVFTGARDLFTMGATLNVVLFAFNMLPIPMLDGFEVLAYFVPTIHRVDQKVKNIVFFVMVIVIFASSRFIFMAGAVATYVTASGMMFVINFLHLGKLF